MSRPQARAAASHGAKLTKEQWKQWDRTRHEYWQAAWPHYSEARACLKPGGARRILRRFTKDTWNSLQLLTKHREEDLPDDINEVWFQSVACLVHRKCAVGTHKLPITGARARHLLTAHLIVIHVVNIVTHHKLHPPASMIDKKPCTQPLPIDHLIPAIS